MSDDLNLFSGADAETELVGLLKHSLVQFNRYAVREMLFLFAYLPADEARGLVERAMQLKLHQSPGASKKILGALEKISLFKQLRSFNIMGGSK